MRYMKYECPSHMKKDQLLTENIIRAMVPKPDVSLVTTFYFGDVKNERTFLFPPILREEVLNLEPTLGDHIIAYFTSGFESFSDLLKSFGRERFLLYGHDRDDEEGNITYKPFSKEVFLKDLAECKAVMATAGFTLMTESIHLQKPYLALPMIGQFEQELNAFLLEELDYGINLREISREAIGDFLYRLPDFETNLKSYKPRGNDEIKAMVKSLLDDDCALAINFHEKRNS
jgi:uncharacterized protein (TIGR00661 family)